MDFSTCQGCGCALQVEEASDTARHRCPPSRREVIGSCTTVDLSQTVTRGGAASSFEVELTISLCCLPVQVTRVPGTYSAEGGSGTNFDGSVITTTLESADLNARTVTYRYGGTRKDGSLQQGYEVVHRDFIEIRVPRFTVRLERQGF